MIGQDVLTGKEGDVRYLPNTVTVKTLDTLIPEDPALAPPQPQPALPAPAGRGRRSAGQGARRCPERARERHGVGGRHAGRSRPGAALAHTQQSGRRRR
jgi:hypothetical protein